MRTLVTYCPIVFMSSVAALIVISGMFLFKVRLSGTIYLCMFLPLVTLTTTSLFFTIANVVHMDRIINAPRHQTTPLQTVNVVPPSHQVIVETSNVCVGKSIDHPSQCVLVVNP